MKLLQNQYVNVIKIVAAYMDKAFQWPRIMPEGGKSMSSFSLFLIACRNAMEDIDYFDVTMDNRGQSSKYENHNLKTTIYDL